jgi:hypothetical protein
LPQGRLFGNTEIQNLSCHWKGNQVQKRHASNPPHFSASLFLLAVSGPCLLGRKTLIDDFASGISSKWRHVSFSGTTLYTAVTVDDRHALKAESRASASGLVLEKQIDPKKLPILSWSWKIEGVLEKGDATTKKGDHYPARIYVVFPSFFSGRPGPSIISGPTGCQRAKPCSVPTPATRP